MLEFLTTPVAQAVIFMAVLMMMSVVGYYVVRRFRDQSGQDVPTREELLCNYREMHVRGELSPGEFRDIKTVLAPSVQAEIKSNSETG